jgi:hypothetical protein
LRLALGGLKWRAADFWDATLTEFFEAINGHNDAQGDDKPEKATGAPNANEMAALLSRFG